MRGCDLSQFHRAVVDKDDAVSGDVPRLQNSRHAARLRVPVNFNREDLVGAQQKVRPIESLANDSWIVLAGDGDQRSGIGERAQQLLIQPVQLGVRREVPAHSVSSNLADDAAPQRVVQVGDDALLRRRR